jgi:signal transduction histidine kinase/CheY-like chemotaxis protein
MKMYMGLILMIGLGGWLAFGLYCEKCAYKSWKDVSHFLVAGDPMVPASIVALEGLSGQCDLYLSSQVAYIKERYGEIESETVASTREFQLGRLKKRIDQFRSEIHCIPGGCQKHADNQTNQFQCADCQSSSLVTFKLLHSISGVVEIVIDSFRPSLLSGFSSTTLAEADAMELQTRRQMLSHQAIEYSKALLKFKEAMIREHDSTVAGAESTLAAAVAVDGSLVHVEQSAGKFKSAFNTLAATVRDVTDAFYLRANEMVLWYSIAMALFVIGASFLFISYVRSLALITNETNRIKEGTAAGVRFTSIFPGIDRLGFALKKLSDGKERIAEQLERKGQQYRDLEKQKELEKQLAGVVAHEYGNKLMVMEGNLLLLQAKMESPELCRLLNSALVACQQAKLITEEFRSSAGRQVHQKATPIRLNSLLENQIEEMAPTFSRAKQVVELDLDPQLKSIIAAEEDLDGILLNLILNAMEANEVVGGKKITIRSLSPEMVDLADTPEELASKIDSGIRYSCFEVIDEGVGITPELGQQVFNLGVTTKGGLRNDYGRDGFGSGLHIVWDMVSANNGAVDFIRNDSMGVKFRVFLPAGPEVDEKQPEVIVIPRLQAEKGRVLLIEDDEDVREVTCAVLRESGWVVEPVASAEEALELYEGNFRMVISDIRLGPARLDGHQFVEEVRARESRIPILLVSGYTQKEVRKCDGPDDGIVDFLKKPFLPEDLLSAMEEVLRKAHPEDGGGGNENTFGALLA